MFFLPNLKKYGYLDPIHITLCIVGSRKLDQYINSDYSHQGWEIFAPNLTIYGFDADRQACEERNEAIAQQKINWTETHIPLAVWDSIGTATLYVTKNPECSSLYPPNELVINRLTEYADFQKLLSTIEVETTTLDEYFKQNPATIDFLQLDVQGGELNVLDGATQLLNNQLLMLCVEVSFVELYKNQPLFADVDIYLRNQEFTLLDFGTKWHGRRQGIKLMSQQHPGQFVWTDAYYARDLIRPDQNFKFKTPERIFKLACIADLLMFYDYALELLAYLTLKYGENSQYNFTDIIIKTVQEHPNTVNLELESIPLMAELIEKKRSSTC